jgi:hypothetical protein
LPNNVDYIRATNSDAASGTSNLDLIGGQLKPGGGRPPATFSDTADQAITYVPTKITMTLTCVPVVSRNTISNDFSVNEYATGKLLRGSQNNKPGVW